MDRSRPKAGILIGIIAMLLVARSASADVLVTLAMLKDDPEGMPGERICLGEADLGKGAKLPYRLEVTTKGNGTLTIGNLQLHVLDEGNNGRAFLNSLLTVELTDLAGTGVKYLIVSGTAVYQEKETDPKVPEGVVFIYRFDASTRKFERVYKHATFDIEM